MQKVQFIMQMINFTLCMVLLTNFTMSLLNTISVCFFNLNFNFDYPF